MPFQFNPPDGFKNKTVFPTTPASEDEFRAQMWAPFEQVRDYINQHLPTLDTPSMGLYRNAIINGNFDVWQRGTSFTTSNGYTADRWAFARTGSAFTTVSRSTDVPDGKSTYSLRFSGDYAPGEVQEFKYYMEGKDAAKFAGQQVTIAFQHKESVSAGNTTPQIFVAYATAPDNFASIHQVGTSGPLSASANYTKVSYTLTLPAVSGGHSIANGLVIIIRHTQGGTTGTLTGNLSQVQLCTGDVALPFQPRSFAEELALCQRYYEKSYEYATPPGTTDVNKGYIGIDLGTDTTGKIDVPVRFSVSKRIAPTVILYDPIGNANAVFRGSYNKPAEAVDIGDTGFVARTTDPTSASGIYFHWTADAEL